MKNINVAVLGGDMRQNYLALELINHDFNVYTFAQENGKLSFDNLSFDTPIDVYIFPMPISKDGVHLNAVLSNSSYKIFDIIEDLPKDSLILGGNITKSIQNMFKEKGFTAIDYLNREELAILNAIPTAEGAISIAIEKMPKTLSGSNVLVLGNGRIGKILSKKLHALGANTTVCARKAIDFADISSNNMECVHLKDVNFSKYDIIFNTIPKCILNEKILRKMPKNTIIIDLASKPGGVDFEQAKKLEIETIWALSLPGKVAPITSAQYIFNSIINILQEQEVI